MHVGKISVLDTKAVRIVIHAFSADSTRRTARWQRELLHLGPVLYPSARRRICVCCIDADAHRRLTIQRLAPRAPDCMTSHCRCPIAGTVSMSMTTAPLQAGLRRCKRNHVTARCSGQLYKNCVLGQLKWLCAGWRDRHYTSHGRVGVQHAAPCHRVCGLEPRISESL
jgi:hypothetical protein